MVRLLWCNMPQGSPGDGASGQVETGS